MNLRQSKFLTILLWFIVICTIIVDFWTLIIFIQQIGKDALRFMEFPYHSFLLHKDRRVEFILLQIIPFIATYLLFWEKNRKAFYIIGGLILFDTLVMLSPAVANL